MTVLTVACTKTQSKWSSLHLSDSDMLHCNITVGPTGQVSRPTCTHVGHSQSARPLVRNCFWFLYPFNTLLIHKTIAHSYMLITSQIKNNCLVLPCCLTPFNYKQFFLSVCWLTSLVSIKRFIIYSILCTNPLTSFLAVRSASTNRCLDNATSMGGRDVST